MKSKFYQSVRERFIRYAKIDTQSSTGADTVPSTQKQFDLAKLLLKELEEMGASDIFLDEHCCLYAKLPSNIKDRNVRSIGYLGHLDVSPDAASAGISPHVLENYGGGDIVLNADKGIVMEASLYPRLSMYIGQDLILSDGTTLLGGDDKAAIAAIMAMAEYYTEHPEIPHGDICIGFLPDEEVGLCGAKLFDIERFGAEAAYTLDGDGVGEFFEETFNGEEAFVTIKGLNVHPGTAKDIMRNAVEIAADFIAMLPAMERPQHTSGREGFYHPTSIMGSVEEAEIRLILRDHDGLRLEERHNYLVKCAETLNARLGEGSVSIKFVPGYRSMKPVVDKHPYLTEYALRAMRDCGIQPRISPMRGGTDGAVLSQRGLPCPNITAGYENAHGRFEFVPVESMAKNTELLLRLNQIYAEEFLNT